MPGPHSKPKPIARRLLSPAFLLLFLITPLFADAPKIVPESVELSPTVKAAASDPILRESERNDIRLFHGLWNDLPQPLQASPVARLAQWDLTSPALTDPAAPPLLRAEAAYRRGDTDLATSILKNPTSDHARLILGESYLSAGQTELGIQTLTPLRDALRQHPDTGSAEQITDRARAMAILATLEGRSAGDYRFILDQLTRAQQQVDRLYGPALVAQGDLLIDKDNLSEAVDALHEALRLNPRCSRAWYLLGQIALRGYDFPSVARAAAKLREIQPDHVLASVLMTENFLKQKDPASAQRTLDTALKRYPHHRRLLACAVAAAALNYDDAAVAAAMKRYEAVAGRSALAPYLAGLYLSTARQYDAGEKMLRQAIALAPNWPQPQIELGLLLSQAGKEDRALAVLRTAVALDPFNKRAINTLKLHEALAKFHRIETPHFIIKYRDPIDRALALDMPDTLETFYREVTAAFDYQLREKTTIEIMPDKQYFAVRVTGMPEVWTIAACTGTVIAMSPPRPGPNQAGNYDWMRVIRHEFTHTVTLEKTNNRVPHWFTEACAVSQEPEPRDYQTCQLLASALAEHRFFTLDQINWAFVRPKRPDDRALAYAQSEWMFEYITERFGHKAILKILDLSRDGAPENQVVPQAVNQTAADFLSGFRDWATRRIASWGLSPEPSAKTIAREIAAAPHAAAKIAELLKKYPDHPDVLQAAANLALDADDDARALPLLLRYAAARPVDPWADARLAEVYTRLKQPAEAISHLQNLDRFDQTSGEDAQLLARIDRQLNHFDDAQHAADRALARRPYDAGLRELAAAIALQRRDLPTAQRQIESLTWIEPDRARHFVRLAAIDHLMGKTDEAKAAALQARKLDPHAAVDAFLK